MANEVTLPPPPAWMTTPTGNRINDELTHGVAESFPILSIRTGKFHIRYQGAEKLILGADGYPVPYLDVIIVRSKKEITKTWYAKGYTTGDRDAPDCTSVDGDRPDPSAPNTPIDPRTGRRMEFCASCPNNIFGSAPGRPDGKGGVIGGGGKACQDARRLAVLIPPHILDGEITPVLLRVPPTSLKPLADFGNKLEANRYHYSGVQTRLSFASHNDKGIAVGHPLLKFEFQQALTQAEFNFVEKMKTDAKTESILRSKVDGVTADVHRPDIQDKLNEAAAQQQYSSVLNTEPAPVQRQHAEVTTETVPPKVVIGTLPDGRRVCQDGTFLPPEKPEEPTVDRKGWTPIHGMPGVWFSPAAGGLVDETGQLFDPRAEAGISMRVPEEDLAPVAAQVPAPVQGEIIPPGEPLPPPTFLGAIPARSEPQAPPPPPPEAKAQATPAEAGAKKTVGRPKRVAPEPAPLTATPASNGGGPQVGSTPPGVDSILAGLKPSGGPQQ